jgi:hypothetical protein
VQPAGPDGLVDLPVTQAGLVAAASGEPAVVEDVPFHPEVGGDVGQRRQLGEVMAKVDGFPDVEVDRPGRARVRGQRAQVAVELGRQAVQPVGAGGRQVDPGRGVGLALGQGDLAGQQELAAADGGPLAPLAPGPDGTRSTRCTVLPLQADVQAVGLAAAEAKPGTPATTMVAESWPV